MTQLISYWLAKDDEQLLNESERDKMDLCFTFKTSSTELSVRSDELKGAFDWPYSGIGMQRFTSKNHVC